MTTTHIDVTPFRAALDVALSNPYDLPRFLHHRVDDATLEAIRFVCDYIARACSSVQVHRRFDRIWQEASLPAVGNVEARELAELLASLPGLLATLGAPGDPVHVVDPAATRVVVPAQKIHPRTGSAEYGGEFVDDYIDEDESAVTAVIPADLVAAVTTHGPWPDTQESETA